MHQLRRGTSHLARRRVPSPTARCAAAVLFLASVALCGCSKRQDERAHGGELRPLNTVATLGALGDTPGRFAYPRAIDYDPIAGSLWVVDRSGRVQELDPDTGACLSIFKMPDTQLGFPVGITIAPGPDSRGEWCGRLLYLADTHYQRVVIVEPPPPLTPDERKSVIADQRLVRRVEPVFVRMYGSYGHEPGQFIYPTDVAVVADTKAQRVERIYVGEYGGNDRVSVFDGDFKFLFSFGAFGTSVSPQDIQFNRPQCVIIDDTPAAAADVAGEPEQSNPLLHNKRLIILDARNHRIGVFSMGGRLIRWIGDPDHPDAQPGHFRFPWGLTLVGDGTSLVCDFVGGRVQHVDLQSGRGLAAWGRAGIGPGELNSPWSMVKLPDRRVFLVDGRNNRLVVFKGP